MYQPKDPVILLSYVNTKLRDESLTLEDFCKTYEYQKEDVVKILSGIGYTYNETLNQFK
jgi:hypothetical protein